MEARKLCQPCGVTTSADQTHCRRCFGVLVAASSAAAAYCDQCGAANLVSFRVCSTCGKKRAKAAPSVQAKAEPGSEGSKDKEVAVEIQSPPQQQPSEKEEKTDDTKETRSSAPVPTSVAVKDEKRSSAPESVPDKPPMPAKPAAAKMAALVSKVKLELQTRRSAGIAMCWSCDAENDTDYDKCAFCGEMPLRTVAVTEEENGKEEEEEEEAAAAGKKRESAKERPAVPPPPQRAKASEHGAHGKQRKTEEPRGVAESELVVAAAIEVDTPPALGGTPPPVPARTYGSRVRRVSAPNMDQRRDEESPDSFEALVEKNATRLRAFVAQLSSGGEGKREDEAAVGSVEFKPAYREFIASQFEGGEVALLSQLVAGKYAPVLALLSGRRAEEEKEAANAVLWFWSSAKLPLLRLALFCCEQHLEAMGEDETVFFAAGNDAKTDLPCRLLGRVLDLGGCGKFASSTVWKIVEEAPAAATVYALVDWVAERLCEGATVPGLVRQLCAALAAGKVPPKHRGKQAAVIAGLFFGQVVAAARTGGQDGSSVLALAFQTTLFSLCAEVFSARVETRFNHSMNDMTKLLPNRSPPPVPPLPAKKPSPPTKRVTMQMVGGGWRKAEAPAQMQPILRQLGDSAKKEASPAEQEDGGRVRYDLMLDEELELPAVEPNPITSPQAYKNYKLLRYERQKRGLDESPPSSQSGGGELSSPRQWTAGAPVSPRGEGPSSPQIGRKKEEGPASPRKREEGPASPRAGRRDLSSPRGAASDYVRPPRSVRPASPTTGLGEAPSAPSAAVRSGARVARSAKAVREDREEQDFDPTLPDPLFCVGDLVLTAEGEEAEVMSVDARGRYSAKVFGERIVIRQQLTEADLRPRARDVCWHCTEYFPVARLKSCGHCGAASKTVALSSPKVRKKEPETKQDEERLASPRLTVMFEDISAAFGELAKWDEEK